MTKEALQAWDYDNRMFHKAMLTAWEGHQKDIMKAVDRDERQIPYSIGSKKKYTRKHPMQFTETVKRNLAVCMTLSTYLP